MKKVIEYLLKNWISIIALLISLLSIYYTHKQFKLAEAIHNEDNDKIKYDVEFEIEDVKDEDGLTNISIGLKKGIGNNTIKMSVPFAILEIGKTSEQDPSSWADGFLLKMDSITDRGLSQSEKNKFLIYKQCELDIRKTVSAINKCMHEDANSLIYGNKAVQIYGNYIFYFVKVTYEENGQNKAIYYKIDISGEENEKEILITKKEYEEAEEATSIDLLQDSSYVDGEGTGDKLYDKLYSIIVNKFTGVGPRD